MFMGGRRRRRRSSAGESDPDAWDAVDEGLGYFDSDFIIDIIFNGMSFLVLPKSCNSKN